jgi:glutamyl-tRNA synthetase
MITPSTHHNKEVRVRFAPSPTGHLHIGGLRTTIFNWLFAKHNNGKFLIRIEDTDLERSKPEYTQSILNSFAWINIQSDEPIVIQSERIKDHQAVLAQLLAEGKAYRCFCSQEEVVARHKAKFGADDAFIKYDGQCRSKQLTHEDMSKPHAIRFALPFAQGEIAWDDLIHGRVSFDADQLDDFIIVRSDGTPMYNFVVVLDDAFMRITHVIRGDDHVSNTPKQILLYLACGYELPQFAHLSMILGPSGERLSKRDGAVSVLEYKQLGYMPDALFNYLVRLGWAHGDQEIFSRQELVQLFTLEHVGKKAAVFDHAKLDWLNGVYMRQTDDAQLLERIANDVRPAITQELSNWSHAQVVEAIKLYKERVKTLAELGHELVAVHSFDGGYNQDDMAQWITPTTHEHLVALVQILEALPHFGVDLVADAVKQFVKNQGLKLVAVAQPIRLALVGKSASPGVFELLALIGKDQSLQRLRALIARIHK